MSDFDRAMLRIMGGLLFGDLLALACALGKYLAS